MWVGNGRRGVEDRERDRGRNSVGIEGLGKGVCIDGGRQTDGEGCWDLAFVAR